MSDTGGAELTLNLPVGAMSSRRLKLGAPTAEAWHEERSADDKGQTSFRPIETNTPVIFPRLATGCRCRIHREAAARDKGDIGLAFSAALT